MSANDDVLVQLQWMCINTMEVGTEEVAQLAITEIKRLRAENKRMRTAGNDLHAWITVNATSIQQDRLSHNRVLEKWEEARSETEFSVWFGWATRPDFIGTRQECEEYVRQKMIQSRGYSSHLTIHIHRAVANERPSNHNQP